MSQTRTGRARDIRVTLPISRSGVGPGTGIMTTEGELPVEFLEPGDRIVTHDQGAVKLAKINVMSVPASAMIRVRPQVLAPKAHSKAFLISARQKIVLTDWRAKAMFGKRAALVEAAKLVDGDYMARLTGSRPVRLFQLMFDDGQHAVQLAAGSMLAASVRAPVITRA